MVTFGSASLYDPDKRCLLNHEKCTILMYADDAVLLFSSQKSKETGNKLLRESELLLTWFKNNSLVPNFKPGRTKIALYGTAKKLHSQESCNVSILGSPINNDSK